MRQLCLYLLVLMFGSARATEPALVFQQNKGQWPVGVLYGTEFANAKVYLNKTGFTYCIYDLKDLQSSHKDHFEKETAKPLHGHVYEVNFEGAVFSESKPENGTSEYYNYFLGNDKSKWASFVKAFKKITYCNIYPKTNLISYSAGGNFKYDLEVGPGGKTNDIRLKYEYIDGLEIRNDNLYIKTSVGDIIEHKPYAYQTINGTKKEVKCLYVKNSNNTISFLFPEGYDKSYTLVIDPTVVVCSYSGATIWCGGYGCTYDNLGNIYNIGAAMIGYPTTTGAFITTVNRGYHSVISKYNSNGSAMIFSTYLGGDSTDYILSSVVKNNELVLLGRTYSKNFPVTKNAYDTTFAGRTDIFITKMNLNGTSLIASTLVGGTGYDCYSLFTYLQEGGEVVCDNQGNVYVCTATASADFPVTSGAASTLLKGGNDACVFKLNSNLSSLVWSTFLGGISSEDGRAIRLDGAGGVYCFGTTSSNNFPVTTGVISTTRSGTSDFYITHLNSNGGIISSTYLGILGTDIAGLMDVDKNNNIYVCGNMSNPASFIATGGVYSNPNGHNCIYKVDPSLSTIIYKTKFGNSFLNVDPDIEYTAFRIDSCNNVYVAGFANNTLPTTANKIQAYGGGNEDIYVAVFKANCVALSFATYFGGPNNGFGYGEHCDGGMSYFDEKGYLYHSICINGGIPTTSNAYAPTWVNTTTLSTSFNNAFFKMDLQTFVNASTSYGSEVKGCFPYTHLFTSFNNTGGVSWNFGDGSALSSSNPASHTYTNIGVYNSILVVTDTNTCNQTDTIRTKIFVSTIPTVALSPASATACVPGCVEFKSTVNPTAQTYSWKLDNGTEITDSINTRKYCFTTTGKHSIRNIVSNLGCTDTAVVYFDAFVKPTADFIYKPDFPVEFTNSEVRFLDASFGGTINTWRWFFTGDSINTSSKQDPTFNYYEPGIYHPVLVVTNTNGCSDTASLEIIIQEDFSVYVPNAFTPNGDGLNDVFEVKGVGIKTYELEIFNRKGMKVFRTNDINDSWNGKYHGSANEFYAVFTWKLTVTNKDNKAKRLVGHVTVVQ